MVSHVSMRGMSPTGCAGKPTTSTCGGRSNGRAASRSASGSFVVDILTIGGGQEPVWQQRLLCALTESAVE
jgi:hypothetical protein